MIFILDDKENLIQVNLFVKDQEGLFSLLTELTDSSYLGEDGNYNIVSDEKKISFGNLVYFGNFRNGDLLVRNHQVSFEPQEYCGKDLEWLFEYRQDVIKCINLNSVLLFFNLLDESSSYLMDELAVEFLKSGILKKQSLDVVWDKFISNLEHEDGIQNLNNFRYALKNNLIGVSIENTWTKEELQEQSILQKYNIDLKKLLFVTDVFNINSSLVKKRG